MGLIRTSILIATVIVMLPSPRESKSPAVDAAFDVIGPFCSEQDNVCVTAEHWLEKLESKARYNIEMLQTWASSGQTGEVSPLANQASADPIKTGSAPRNSARHTGSLRNTLRLDDLIPVWRAPEITSKS